MTGNDVTAKVPVDGGEKALPWQLLRQDALNLLAEGTGPDKQGVAWDERVVTRISVADRTIVESFVRGWPHAAESSLAPFEQCLDRLLFLLRAGPLGAGVSAPAELQPPTMIQSDLWQVLQRIRESGELFYARECVMNELDRRVMFALYANGPLPALDVCGAMGVDKAQISRALKRLIEAGLIERAQLRAPVVLTARGRDVACHLSRLAELRNRELTLGVTDEELKQLFAIIDLLLDRSIILYEMERDGAQGGANSHLKSGKGAAIYALVDDRRPSEKLPIDRTRVISPLLTLSAYFSRSGALAYRRAADLSAFEAFVMSEIGRNAPIMWGRLVHELQRDHSQAGRTVTALIERGLVVRHGKAGRRNGSFDHTKEGKAIYRIICDVAAERSACLMAPLSTGQRNQFLSIISKIRCNAERQLEREQALVEGGRPNHKSDRPA